MPTASQRIDKTLDDTALLQSWNEDGHIFIRHFFSSSKVDLINRLVDQLWDTHTEDTNNLVIDTNLNSDKYKKAIFQGLYIRNEKFSL